MDGRRSTRATRSRPVASVVALAVLTALATSGCGERDDPVVTPSPAVSPSATPLEPSPAPTTDDGGGTGDGGPVDGGVPEPEPTVTSTERLEDGVERTIPPQR